MADNPYVNKVVYGNEVLIDLSEDTVTESTLKRGVTAHSMSGEQITGELDVLPSGGSDGDVLVKNGATDYDGRWTKTPPQMGSLATIEPTSSASKAYALDDYLVYNGQLYKVVIPISPQDTLNPGTNGNIVATNVFEVIHSTGVNIPLNSGIQGGMNVNKRFGIVEMNIGNLKPLTYELLTTVCTLPEKYWPSSRQFLTLTNANDPNYIPSYIIIETNGIVNVVNRSGAVFPNNMYAHTTYFAK